jgi:uncharacterized protein (TIGR04255 family)
MPKFSLTPVNEVHLDSAPLAKVLTQVQYSRTPQLVTDSAEALIAQALDRYPVRRRQMAAALAPMLIVNGQQLQPPGGFPPSTALSFSDPAGEWLVTVTETAVALETSAYGTRDDFSSRASEIFAAIATVALPPVVDRLGVRYIDRLSGDAIKRVPAYFAPQLTGLIGYTESSLELHHSITESQIDISSEESMLVRSGLLPAGSAFDPSLPPIPVPSWVLDTDVFTTRAQFAFEPAELTTRLRRFAETAYAFFRFATTEEFQSDHFGQSAPLFGQKT